VKILATDESQHVRTSLAGDVMGLAPLFGKEGTQEHLLDLFLQLLKDDNPEVRLNIIGKLSSVTPVLDLEQLSQHLLPAIVELAEDRQWRVRLAIIEYIPLLAEQLGVDFFNDKLSGLCMSWLNDCVSSIREAATNNLKRLVQVFGHVWAADHVIPKVVELTKHTNYLYRATPLFAITTLATVLPADVVASKLLPLALTLCGDPIPNVRFTACKTVQSLSSKLDAAVVESKVKPALAKLLEDKDRDVRYFASVAGQ